MTSTNKLHRIKQELIAAGITSYGLGKAESRYLPKILHADEHIGGVVYGRYEAGGAMLVATNKRVIFIDKKPLFTTNEEVTYAVVSGFKITRNSLMTSVVLHTKVKDFSLRFVNPRCATIFKRFIESRSLEGTALASSLGTPAKLIPQGNPFLSDEALAFLQSNDVAVLSTTDTSGQAHGAVVYYLVDEQHRLYVLTKSETTKARNILKNNQVAITIFNAQAAQTLQIQGQASIETDEVIKKHIFNNVMKPHKYTKGYQLPPVAWLQAGMFVIITIHIQSANFSDFGAAPRKD